MKNSQAITLFIVLVLLIAAALFFTRKQPVDTGPIVSEQDSSSILGCYIATIGNDVYTLNIQSQENGKAFGTLAFKNYQKDSSSGMFTGSYQDGILLGDYAFRSEGMDSVMQVVFKKTGQDFVRGYGEMNAEGTRFADLSKITYDASSPLSLFKKGNCPLVERQVVITSPKGGETLSPGSQMDLAWTGGPEIIQIFLIDTSLKPAGTSVSISDRIYNVKNTGTYTYTIPATMKVGAYEFQIGTSTSKTFMIISR